METSFFNDRKGFQLAAVRLYSILNPQWYPNHTWARPDREAEKLRLHYGMLGYVAISKIGKPLAPEHPALSPCAATLRNWFYGKRMPKPESDHMRVFVALYNMVVVDGYRAPRVLLAMIDTIVERKERERESKD